MDEVKTIVVAVDFSDYSLKAVRYAVSMARNIDAGLLLVNVINQKDIDTATKIAEEYQAFTMQKYIQDTIAFRKGELRKLIEELGIKESKVKTSIRIGVPCIELLKEIEEKKPDLLVMSTKGRTNVADMIVGSCAQKMFQRCPIPLLILRNQKKGNIPTK